MVNYNIDYKPGLLNDNELNDFRIGNGFFSDNVWDFSGYESTTGGSARVQLRFSFIKQERIKNVVKAFSASCLLKQKLSGVKRALQGFSLFYRYISDHHPNIQSLAQLNALILRGYFHYLYTTDSNKTKGPLSRTGIFHAAAVIKNILIEGNHRGWHVPEDCRWVLPIYCEMIENNPRTKMSAQATKKMFSDEVVQKIIQSAIKEQCIITKAAIILQSQIGFRISEVLELRPNCIKNVNGKIKIECCTQKTKKGRVMRLKPANQLVSEAIVELENATKDIREASGVNYLFIKRTPAGEIIRCNESNWTRDYMQPFVERWDIRETGELIHLTSHYFRHIFATHAYRKGMPIQSIMKMFDHESLTMTGVYTHISAEDAKVKFAEVISGDAVIVGMLAGKIQERLAEDNPFKGKTQQQTTAIINAMNINITANGFCFHHPARRDSCADDGECLICPNFVTTADFLPVHKKRVTELEKEMDRAQKSGNNIWYIKNKRIRDRIINTFIKPLESELMVRLK
ncbi:putative Integrase family protein [uncultured Sporomusa sp.]|uniref:Putative Integrase family protein n=1 Tax=uncultured Sporomusa sp. TaxID=307249 RepID=A0A212LXS6_9FIRM|nr:tyrosine-type recombinase/integrase [uncultured Sporomusa sp.]SCM82306.1 putative Integrase family protein [uncultured Sporomusa sp.]